MSRTVRWYLVGLGWLVVGACQPAVTSGYQPGAEALRTVVDAQTDAMVHDMTNPPLASRFFAYALLAGYEVVTQHDSTMVSMAGLLNGYPVVKKPALTGYHYPLAAQFAMLQTATRLQPSGHRLDSCQRALTAQCSRAGLSTEVIEASRRYGHHVADALVAYARQDGYRRISDYPRYTPARGEGQWYPTPPAFFGAVEPHFNKVRAFVLDSAAQFRPAPPQPFNAAEGSDFYHLMRSVYQISRSSTMEQKRIAAFWDCNPFAMQDAGHLQIGIKKMSPGAHWMKIAGMACRRQGVSFNQAMQIHAVLAVTLLDAFICCWDEKFRSNRIRPETAIRRHLDPTWKPLLQTPPFPEYLSGHSVVSAASAEVLSHYFGDQFAYVDSTERMFGVAPRRFASFRQAALEAGLSRYYGGIHFMDAIEEGQRQGERIGGFVLTRLLTGQLRPSVTKR